MVIFIFWLFTFICGGLILIISLSGLIANIWHEYDNKYVKLFITTSIIGFIMVFVSAFCLWQLFL